MGKAVKPSRELSAEAAEATDFDACIHEAAHVIVDRAFGIPVAFVTVAGGEGVAQAAEPPAPDDDRGRARHYWARSCTTVAGDVGELLARELEDADGDWRSHEERVRQVNCTDELCQALSAEPENAPRYPDGELGVMLRYAVLRVPISGEKLR